MAQTLQCWARAWPTAHGTANETESARGPWTTQWGTAHEPQTAESEKSGDGDGTRTARVAMGRGQGKGRPAATAQPTMSATSTARVRGWAVSSMSVGTKAAPRTLRTKAPAGLGLGLPQVLPPGRGEPTTPLLAVVGRGQLLSRGRGVFQTRRMENLMALNKSNCNQILNLTLPLNRKKKEQQRKCICIENMNNSVLGVSSLGLAPTLISIKEAQQPANMLFVQQPGK